MRSFPCSQTRALQLLVLLAFLVSGCTFTSTGDALSGAALTTDKNPVLLYLPTDKAAVSQNPTFSWSSKTLEYYTLEISEKTDFSTVVVSKNLTTNSYTLSAADLQGIGNLDAITYYWRVRSGTASSGVLSTVNSFNVLENGVYYVAKASGGSSTTVGNKTAPFTSIVTALAVADANRGGDFSKAVSLRVATGTYNEYVIMVSGISLYAGYEKSGWTRNITANPTTIQAVTSTGLFIASIPATYQATTILDGFTISVPSTGSDLIGISLSGASPTISNCAISLTNGAAGKYAYGIYMSGASSPLLQKNTVSATTTNGGVASALYSAASSGTVLNNSLSSAATLGGTSAAIYLTAGSAGDIQRNIVSATSSAGGTGTYGILGSASSPSQIRQNVIYAQTSATNPVSAIELDTYTISTISNNTIYGESSTQQVRGIIFTSVAPVSAISTTILSNVIVLKTNAAGNKIYFGNPNNAFVRPASLSSNVFLEGGGSGAIIFYNDNVVGTGNAYGFICPGTGQFSTLTGCGGTVYSFTPATANKDGVSILNTFGTATLNTTNLKSWTIAAGGPADFDSSGGYTTGDAGANAAVAGP